MMTCAANVRLPARATLALTLLVMFCITAGHTQAAPPPEEPSVRILGGSFPFRRLYRPRYPLPVRVRLLAERARRVRVQLVADGRLVDARNVILPAGRPRSVTLEVLVKRPVLSVEVVVRDPRRTLVRRGFPRGETPGMLALEPIGPRNRGALLVAHVIADLGAWSTGQERLAGALAGNGRAVTVQLDDLPERPSSLGAVDVFLLDTRRYTPGGRSAFQALVERVRDGAVLVMRARRGGLETLELLGVSPRGLSATPLPGLGESCAESAPVGLGRVVLLPDGVARVLSRDTEGGADERAALRSALLRLVSWTAGWHARTVRDAPGALGALESVRPPRTDPAHGFVLATAGVLLVVLVLAGRLHTGRLERLRPLAPALLGAGALAVAALLPRPAVDVLRVPVLTLGSRGGGGHMEEVVLARSSNPGGAIVLQHPPAGSVLAVTAGMRNAPWPDALRAGSGGAPWREAFSLDYPVLTHGVEISKGGRGETSIVCHARFDIEDAWLVDGVRLFPLGRLQAGTLRRVDASVRGQSIALAVDAVAKRHPRRARVLDWWLSRHAHEGRRFMVGFASGPLGELPVRPAVLERRLDTLVVVAESM